MIWQYPVNGLRLKEILLYVGNICSLAKKKKESLKMVCNFACILRTRFSLYPQNKLCLMEKFVTMGGKMTQPFSMKNKKI